MAKYPLERECAYEGCAVTFTAKVHNATWCAEHRATMRRESEKRRRSASFDEQVCIVCHSTYTPYRSGQLTCGKPECQRQRYNDKRGGDIPERDEQMNKLFRYYKSRESIEVNDLKDGTRVMVVSDHQLPFIDQEFEDAKQTFISDWKPQVIVFAGDVLDAYELSDFDKRPERLFNLQDELQMARDLILTYKRLSPGVRIYWIDGNHEERMQRIIWRKAQEFSFMVKDVPEALELEKITEGFVPYGKHVDIHGFIITHGNVARMHSAYTAKAMLDRYRSSGASGHTHRVGAHSMTDHRGVSHTWYELGCACRLDLEYMKSPPNWQHAFLLGEVYNNALHPSLVRVVEAHGQRGFTAGGIHYRL